LRKIKEREELAYLRKAAEIAVRALEFAPSLLLPGRKEAEIAAELERFIRYHGASASAFEIIVASGPNSSYPHHLTSARRLKENEIVLIDIGASYCGYKSDLTRVFFLGKINPLAAKIYAIVRRAQARSIAAIRPGARINKIDQAARQSIARAGYGRFFSHSLGHGIGLEIHEAPSVSPGAKDRLKKGMVFTVEPAVYLPGKFGIRIEDTVLVTEKGAEVFSGALHK
jgi:Xaa-Pro aminopeptidase